MPKTKSKGQAKKSYMKFLISKQVEQTEKKIKKLMIKEIKNTSQNEINQLTKDIIKSENKIKTYSDIMNNLDNPSYIEMLGEQFSTLQELEQFITKDMPQNMTIIEPQKGPKHLLIEQKIPLLKSQKNIWNYISDSIEDIIKDTEFYWNAFRIEETIDLSISKKFNNQQIIIDKTRKSLGQLKKTHGIDMTFCVPPNCKEIKEVIQKTIVAYTGSFFTVINNASTSKDVVILKGIRYLFQILIKNYRLGLFGTPLANKINLFRNITIPQELFSLYKKNGIIYFTNLTSASKKNLNGFGGPGGNGKIHILFLIKLRFYYQQKSSFFYSGLDIDSKSVCKGEEQVLIFPFQFFLITNICQKSTYNYEITIQEQKSKAIIQKMEQPIKKNTKKCTFNTNNLKKTLQSITEKQQKVIQKKVAIKKQLIEEFKQKILKVSQKQYEITHKNQEQTKVNSEQDQDSEDHDSGYLFTILQMNNKKKLDDALITHIQQEKESSKQKIEKIQEMTKQCKNINEILNKIYENQTKNNQDKKSQDTIKQIEFKKQIILDQVINTISKQQEQVSNQITEKLSEMVKQKKMKFSQLKVRTNVELTQKQYVIMTLQEAFNSINQKTIIKQSLPESLYKFYVERLTIGDFNNFLYKFYFYSNNKTQKELKQLIQNKFKNKYIKAGQSIKLCFQSDKKLQTLIVQSSQSYDNILEILKQVENNGEINIVKSMAVTKYSSLVYCEDMIDKRGHNDYIKNHYPMEPRGHQDYHFPNGCLRIGLKVWNVYQNNNWLTMNNSPGQWPIIYTPFSQVKINQSYYGKENSNSVSKNLYPVISEKAINCTSDFDLLTKYMPKVTINDQQIYVGFQCRVDPNELQYSSLNKKYCYVDRSKTKSIRPYGIILKKA